jgi:3-oxoacyl-[acyl-carrier protein] reductase
LSTSLRHVAIITGAGSVGGIGFATAARLGREGCRVVVTSTSERIFDRVRELRESGVEAVGVIADLTTDDGVTAVVQAATSAYGTVSILVNNAGMTSVSDPDVPGSISHISKAQWHASLERNLTTTFSMIRATVTLMEVAGFGRIVNVASVSGPLQAYSGDVAYHAAKAGVIGLTRAVAIDAAPHGITANAVAPGWIDTSSASDHERAMGRATPVGRPGRPTEVAAAIAFLASEEASYITGQILVVDGANSINEERALS